MIFPLEIFFCFFLISSSFFIFCIYLPFKWLDENLLQEYQWALENLPEADIMKHMAMHIMDIFSINLSMIPDAIIITLFFVLFLLAVSIPLFTIITIAITLNRSYKKILEERDGDSEHKAERH